MKNTTKRYDKFIQDATIRYLPLTYDWRLLKAQYIQESSLDCEAVSPVGAKGIAQFMPGTWVDVRKRMGREISSPCNAEEAIQSGAFYMNSLMSQWKAERPQKDRIRLALASYNAGLGNILKAQKLSGGANDYESIISCLHRITGEENAKQTVDYSIRIFRNYEKMCEED